MMLPRAYGEAVLKGKFRSVPEDFHVEEIDAFEAQGEGEHLLLTIEKRGLNTAFVAKELSKWAGIGEMGIGYAGLKDRHAVTRQRFTVHLPKKVAPDFSSLKIDGVKLLESHWHHRKLPRGALAGNRFTLLLRDIEGDVGAIENRLENIRDFGLPNYFGEQRFGRERANVGMALKMFAGDRVKREQRSIYLSAARSEIFNAVLASRIENKNWLSALEGEVWMIDGTHSIFGPEPLDDALKSRADRLEIHATGPLWGKGELRTRAQVADCELAVAGAHRALCEGLEAADMKQERRALRIQVPDLSWKWLQKDQLECRFSLPPGAYATELLAELGDLQEQSQNRA
ncbi:MAG TPA: tRNA pseudouridine(13) synthase TruD [Arenimonas sp.]|nr:tRNA pseudouridine(13) synthase TruD [Arenimonas sp.]HPW32965.1 tRNA pseudouridine(13) synthase TruD [Arenimonas sp.]